MKSIAQDWMEFARIGGDSTPAVQARAYRLWDRIVPHIPPYYQGELTTARTIAVNTGDDSRFIKACCELQLIIWWPENEGNT